MVQMNQEVLRSERDIKRDTERDREGGSEGGQEGGREGERERVCAEVDQFGT